MRHLDAKLLIFNLVTAIVWAGECEFYCRRSNELRCNTLDDCDENHSDDQSCVVNAEFNFKLILRMLNEGSDECECTDFSGCGKQNGETNYNFFSEQREIDHRFHSEQRDSERENLQGANFHILGKPGFDPHRRRPTWNYHYNQSVAVTLAKHEYGCHRFVKPLLLLKQVSYQNEGSTISNSFLEKFLILESATKSDSLFYLYLGKKDDAISQGTSDLKDFLVMNGLIHGSRVFDMILMNFNNTVQDMMRFCSCIHTKTCASAYFCPKFKLYWWHVKLQGTRLQQKFAQVESGKSRRKRGGCTNPLSKPGYDSPFNVKGKPVH